EAHIRVALLHAGGALAAPAAEGAEPRADDARDVLPEEDEHRRLGAELRDGGEGGPRVSPADDVAEDAQVRARRDRQELGEALEETQDDRFEEVHRVILSGLEQEIG